MKSKSPEGLAPDAALKTRQRQSFYSRVEKFNAEAVTPSRLLRVFMIAGFAFGGTA
jgi:hypothetical protein